MSMRGQLTYQKIASALPGDVMREYEELDITYIEDIDIEMESVGNGVDG